MQKQWQNYDLWSKESRIILQKVKEEINKLLGTKKSKEWIGMGADQTPTAYIDKIAEDIIIDHFKKLPFGFFLLSEEVGWFSHGENPQITIVIDPIEGTHNAMRRIPPYASMFGVSASKNMEDMFYSAYIRLDKDEFWEAKKDQGAFCEGKKVEPSLETKLDNAIIGVDSFFTRTYQGPHGYRESRNYGTISIHDLYVSSGQLEGMINAYGRRPHDIAVPAFFLQESGCAVTNISGKSLTGTMLEDKIKLTTLAAGNKQLYDQLKNMISEGHWQETRWQYR